MIATRITLNFTRKLQFLSSCVQQIGTAQGVHLLHMNSGLQFDMQVVRRSLFGFFVILIEMFSLICRSHLPDKSKTTFNNGQKPQKEFIKDKASC